MSRETIQKIADANRGKPSKLKGRPVSEEVRQRLILCNKMRGKNYNSGNETGTTINKGFAVMTSK